MVEAILAAARAQMREDGVAALNLHEVARRVGMTTPGLYKYFASKASLYDALFRLGTRLYRGQLEALNLTAAASAESALRGAIEHQLGFAVRYPELYQLTLQRPVPGFVPSEEGLKEAAHLEEVGREILDSLIRRGLIAPPGPPERAFNLLLTVMSGLADAHLANEPHLPAGQGRFGSLVPDAVRMFAAAWVPAKSKKAARRPKREAGE
jgi:AcrR family transcriptional regulator